MKKSINIYCVPYDVKQKLDAIKKAGYDEVFITLNDNNDSIKWKEQINYAKSLDLPITMIHCIYYEPNLNYFWEKVKKGDEIEKSYIHQIKQCGKYTNNFVIHLSGSKEVKQTPIGLERIIRMLKVCEKFNVNLAIENLYSQKEIEYIFNNISHRLLKICFDCGHVNFLTKNFDLMKNYGKYVSVLHIHDNSGVKDEHKIIGCGNINIKHLAKNLSNYKDLVLASEIRFVENLEKVLDQNLKALQMLDDMIG